MMAKAKMEDIPREVFHYFWHIKCFLLLFMSSGEKEKLCLLNLTASSLQDEAFQFSMVDMLGLKKNKTMGHRQRQDVSADWLLVLCRLWLVN